jgi:hypothetical protein
MATIEARKRAYSSFRERKDAAGLCVRCQNQRVAGKTRCADCLAKENELQKKRYHGNLGYYRTISRDARRRAYRADPAKAKAYQRERYRKDPDKFRGYEFKQHYGITLEQYRELDNKQRGLCAICGKPPMIGKRGRLHLPKHPPRLHVDHDHTTGRVRGLLCHWCNSHIIAGIEKSGASLMRIAEYLGITLERQVV